MSKRFEKLDRTLGTLINRVLASVIFVMTAVCTWLLIGSDEFKLVAVKDLFALSILAVFFWLAIFLWKRKQTFSDILDAQE